MNSFLIKTGYILDVVTGIWSRQDYTGIAYSDGDEVEQRIASIINEASDLGVLSSELRQHCTDWPSLYHLSGTRANILRPFENDLHGDILEIGAGCGAITRYLGECGGNVLALEGSPRRAAIARARTRDLQNVTVVSDRFDLFSADQKFDAITLIGVLEYANLFTPGESPALNMLERVRALLKPEGKLFIAIENQLGLKYFAGAPEDHLGQPMYGIEGRYRNDQPQTFGRIILAEMLKEAGFSACDFLAPFPDYKLPVSVITERGFKTEKFDAAAFAWQSVRRDPQLPSILAFSPELVWPTLAQNGLALDLANSFLIVASSNKESNLESSTLAWHFTTERKKEFCKTTQFVQTEADGIEVRYKSLAPALPRPVIGKSLKFDIPDRASYVYGTPLSQEFIRIVTRDGWRIEELCILLRKYLDIVANVACAKWQIEELSEPTIKLPGSTFDCIPQNIITSTDGGAHIIDKEWEATESVQIGFLCFRSLITLFHNVTKFGHSVDEFGNTYINLVQTVMSGLGWLADRRLIISYASLEAAIQTEVSGRVVTPKETMDWLDSPISKLNNLNQAVTEKDGQIASLSQAVVERDGQIVKYQWEKSELHSQLMTLSDWAARIDTNPIRHGIKKNVLIMARATLRSLPVSIATKQRMRGIFFSALRLLRQPGIEHESPFSDSAPPPEAQTPFTGVGRDIFIFSVIDWHFRIQRSQHLAKSLAEEGRRVFFFSNHFVDANTPGYQLERISCSYPLYQVKLHVKSAPAIYFDAPTEEILGMLTRSIAKFIRDFKALSSLSIVQHAYWYPLVKRLPNSYRIYDCMDYHEGFGNVPAKLRRIEEDMLCNADLVTVTSSWLEDFAAKHNSNVAMVRNAAEYEHFAVRPEQVYIDAKGRRIIGYYGAIAEWFDIDLVLKIAQTFTDCLILLVGNDTVGAGKYLVDLANIEFTGEVPYARLPYYLHAFDVCLLPFKVIPLTLATNPVKVYEYLAAGKTVVCVDLPEIDQFHNLVLRACSHEDFLAQVKMSLEENCSIEEQLSADRRRFASEQTWRHRGTELIQAVESVQMPRVSVIILTFNNLDLTRACLDSVLSRSDYPNLEIIVVDNNSSDETPSFLEDLARSHPAIRVVRNSENIGFAAGNNVGLDIATGEYLVILNNDTVVTQGWVMTLLRHLQDNPELGIIGPVTNNIGNEARISTTYQNTEDMPAEALRYTLANMGRIYPLRTAAFFCVMFHRSVYEKCGPISEDYGRGFFEDDDYCRKVEAIQKCISCAEDVFIHHHLSASFNKLKSEERQELFRANKEKYESKWGVWIPHSYRRSSGVLHKTKDVNYD